MKKRFLFWLAMLAVLCTFTGCQSKLPTVEDTFSTAVSWGNYLAAEQGEYLAMRGEKDGKPGLILYHKPGQKAYFLLEGDVYQIGLLGNRVFYKIRETNDLHCFTLSTREDALLEEDVYAYQVHGNTLYFIKKERGNYYYTIDLQTGTKGTVETGYTVDSLYLTDYGFYYYDDGRDLLMVRPADNNLDRIVYKGNSETVRDVISLGGADIAFLATNDNTGVVTLISYKASENKTTEHLSGSFTHFNVAKGHAVVIENQTIYAVDAANKKTYTWGSVDSFENIEIMSDCVILYNGNKAGIQYYPETEE
ncbi:MAG: hypothetical protein DBX52_00030 [Clostridiales bacterium]|nr:MAG: hypothetical protein DBX52_00030 [Clostridiales bacterium]